MKASGVELNMLSNVRTDSTSSIKGNESIKSTNSGNSFSSVMSKAGETGEISNASFQSNGNGKNKFSMVSSTKSKQPSITKSNDSRNSKNLSSDKSSTALKDVVEKIINGAQIDAVAVNDVYGEELAEKLKDTLGLTDEEFEELLSQMGINVMQLFNPETLQQFVLQSFGAENVTDALLNEELANALIESSKVLDEVVTSLEHEIVSIAENPMTNQTFDEALSSAVEQDADEVDMSSKDGKENLKQNIEVEVQKETAVESSREPRESRAGDHAGTNAQSSGETFVDYFANKVDLTNVGTENISIPEFKEIVTDLVDKIKLTINPSNTSVELVLNPESLGSVHVVVATKNGVLTAQLNVENHIAKEALESSLQMLKESFEGQGLKVEKVEVTIGNYTSEYAEQEGHGQEQANQTAKKKIRLEDYMDESNDSTVEEQKPIINSMNGTVEYTA